MILPRRALAAGLAVLAAPSSPGARALPGQAASSALTAALRDVLPPSLDAGALGRWLRAAHPACTPAECLVRAGVRDLATLPSRVAADFAAGRVVAVDGWLLSRTEAWLCAAIT